MIRYSNQEGLIPVSGIRFRKGQDSTIVLPEIAVGLFSTKLFNNVINEHPEFNPTKVAYLNCANFERDIYTIDYKGTQLTFFVAGIAGPLLSSDIQDLAKHGVKTFIIFGNCGVLDKNIEDCSIIIPTKAFRDEGVSQHYVPDSETIDMNPKFIPEFEEVLKKYNMPHTKGYTWTTDGFYRETVEKRDYYKSHGAVCVEMEGAALAAVCKRQGLDYFTFYYAGDNLDAPTWDARSISCYVNFDKKKIVPILAFELANKINK